MGKEEKWTGYGNAIKIKELLLEFRKYTGPFIYKLNDFERTEEWFMAEFVAFIKKKHPDELEKLSVSKSDEWFKVL